MLGKRKGERAFFCHYFVFIQQYSDLFSLCVELDILEVCFFQ